MLDKFLEMNAVKQLLFSLLVGLKIILNENKHIDTDGSNSVNFLCFLCIFVSKNIKRGCNYSQVIFIV